MVMVIYHWASKVTPFRNSFAPCGLWGPHQDRLTHTRCALLATTEDMGTPLELYRFPLRAQCIVVVSIIVAAAVWFKVT
jgi:hypothetical protein